MMPNKVIVQFTTTEDTDFDWLLHIEETLIQAFMLDKSASVDGHDIGQGRFNIFIHLSNGWEPALERVTEALDGLGVLPKALIAKFHGDTEKYEVVRPDSYSGRFAL
jgi:hypothetical protein